jgi:signal transduction histidine kinase
VQNQFDSIISGPILSEGSDRDLYSGSTLADLPLYHFQAELSCPILTVARIFDKYPLVPGVILVDNGQFVGMISRRRLLEQFIRPHGRELFLNESLEALYSYVRVEMLVLPETKRILTAAPLWLRRSPELLGEPIVVRGNLGSFPTEPSPLSYQLLDIHKLNITYWQIRGIETQIRYERAQVQMIQTEKMASLGRLVDGVAHEILDPVGFIWGNLTHLTTYSESLLQLLSAYEELLTEPPEEITELKEEIEFDFLQADFPATVASIKSGAERLTKLASSLQNFCYIDEVNPKPADLHAQIDSLILLLKNRLSGEIEIVKNYDYLPPITCFSGQLNQVFMNILTNAINALIESSVSQKLSDEFKGGVQNKPNFKPKIEITTKIFSRLSEEGNAENLGNNRWISIIIADNGPGMSVRKQQQIYDSFSTEKRALKETSLAVSYQIVTAKHGGQLKMRSELGVGSEFEILLPLI